MGWRSETEKALQQATQAEAAAELLLDLTHLALDPHPGAEDFSGSGGAETEYQQANNQQNFPQTKTKHHPLLVLFAYGASYPELRGMATFARRHSGDGLERDDRAMLTFKFFSNA